MICPVLTVCGHAFCYQCLDQSQLFSSNCPNCRENIRGVELIGCGLLDRLIRRTAHSAPSQPWTQAYNERLRKFRDWRRSREVDLGQLRAGQQLDVRDTENIWCQGTVVEVEWEGRRPSTVLIHFNRWNSIYNEIIELPSLRLAPLQFFSSRTDIPRYNLSQTDNNMRGLVISGNSDPGQRNIDVEDSSSEEPPNLPSRHLPLPIPIIEPPRSPLFVPLNMPTNNVIGDFLSGWDFSRIFQTRNSSFQDSHVNLQDSHS
jgi:hypothetical protein